MFRTGTERGLCIGASRNLGEATFCITWGEEPKNDLEKEPELSREKRRGCQDKEVFGRLDAPPSVGSSLGAGSQILRVQMSGADLKRCRRAARSCASPPPTRQTSSYCWGFFFAEQKEKKKRKLFFLKTVSNQKM